MFINTCSPQPTFVSPLALPISSSSSFCVKEKEIFLSLDSRSLRFFRKKRYFPIFFLLLSLFRKKSIFWCRSWGWLSSFHFVTTTVRYLNGFVSSDSLRFVLEGRHLHFKDFLSVVFISDWRFC